MTIVGAGAGIAELTALAVVSELAPTRKRGQYVAVLIFTIVPFVPSSFYAQLIACQYNNMTMEEGMLTTHRPFKLAIRRHHRLRIQRHWLLPNPVLLLPAAPSQLHGQVEEGIITRDRLSRRLS
jgi:hypothetical protein